MISDINMFQYQKPNVILLSDNGLEISELAGRTAYGSFNKSKSNDIQIFIENMNNNKFNNISFIDDIENRLNESELLSQLSWVTFHHSVLEHIILQYYISNISRGVLAELTRHRIASYTVKSTRYTLYPILLSFIIVQKIDLPNLTYYEKLEIFCELIDKINFTILLDHDLKKIEYKSIYDKLDLAYSNKPNDFLDLILSKEQKEILSESKINTYYANLNEILNNLINAKQKRNSGDQFKYIVTDNFSTDLVLTINVRSLKNFLTLRNSNSAWFQIRDLAQKIIEITPKKYLNLMIKEKNETSIDK